MQTTVKMVREWLGAGHQLGATHVIVVCDTFDWEDYPVYVMPDEDVREKVSDYDTGKHPMQKVMEVYALHLSWEAQLREKRAFHFETARAN